MSQSKLELAKQAIRQGGHDTIRAYFEEQLEKKKNAMVNTTDLPLLKQYRDEAATYKRLIKDLFDTAPSTD
jgi:hypothetical protein